MLDLNLKGLGRQDVDLGRCAGGYDAGSKSGSGAAVEGMWLGDEGMGDGLEGGGGMLNFDP